MTPNNEVLQMMADCGVVKGYAVACGQGGGSPSYASTEDGSNFMPKCVAKELFRSWIGHQVKVVKDGYDLTLEEACEEFGFKVSVVLKISSLLSQVGMLMNQIHI